MCVDEQIEKICDKESFRELEGNLTMEMLLSKDRYYFGKYKESLEKLMGKTFSNEGLVTGTAKINGNQVVLAITDLKFFGGSFGAVFGEKFKRAVDYAVSKKIPFITITASGGAVLSLPWLESMVLANEAKETKPAQRMAFFYLPNGIVRRGFFPGEGDRPLPKFAGQNNVWRFKGKSVPVGSHEMTFTPTLAPLHKIRQHVSLITGLDRQFRGQIRALQIYTSRLGERGALSLDRIRELQKMR